MKRINSILSMGAFLLLLPLGQPQAHAYTHPCVPLTQNELNTLKASINQEPWKTGYKILANTSTSQLTWPMEGPFATVTRNPNLNLTAWSDDMSAVKNCAMMWVLTGSNAYAQKAHDILIAWGTTQTSMGGQEAGLALGDVAEAYAGGADILRGTWPGWTANDTAIVENLFLNVYWPVCSGAGNTPGEFNKGLLNMKAAIFIAAFCDDTTKFNHVIDTYRSYPAAGPFNLLPIGETGETGRDAGHVYGGFQSAAFICECAWKQGIDLYSDLDNRLLAAGEYYVRNTFYTDNPFVPYGTVDYTYYANPNVVGYIGDRAAFYLLQNAYKNRFHIPTPWIDLKLQQENVYNNNWLYAKTADYTTATPQAAIVRPAVSVASSGLTLTTLGNNTSGRSASYSNGVWTLTGPGTDVWNNVTDDCQFDYQAMTGDCALVAKVTSIQYVNGSTKAGLMIRDNLSPTVAERAWIAIVPSTGTNLVQCHQTGYTETWGGSGWDHRSDSLPPGMPYWLKVERRGNLITTYTSQDGTTWAPIISSYYANLPSTVYIGLFSCSGATTTTTTVTFANVAFTGGSGGLVTTPAAPAAVFADGASKSITVRWLPCFGATSYNVLRSSTSGSGYAAIASNLSSSTSSYVDTTAAAGTTYYYVVQAVNSAGTSGNSPQFSASLSILPMVNLAFGGTANDSANNSSNAANAFDKDPGSQWFYTGTIGWLQYDFGANNAQAIKRYTLTAADTLTARDPKNWTFLGSQDGSTWTTLDTQNNQAFGYIYHQLIYNIGNTTAYRYYRINVTANNGDSTFLHIGELGLWSNTGRIVPDGRYQIVNRNSGKVVDVTGLNTANGTPIEQWTFNGGTNQKWDIAWQGNGQYRFTDVNSGKVMDNGGTSTGNVNFVIQPWNGSTTQLWKIAPDSDGFYQVVSQNSAMNMDVLGGSTANGASVVQWPYNGKYNQQWMPSLSQ